MEYTKEFVQSPIVNAEINDTTVTMREIQLTQLLKAHEELIRLKIGVAGKLGFVPAGEATASWRPLKLQQQLVDRGASKTLYSNHRRAVAVDCYADWDYIERIQATMNKYGFFNDLAYIKNSKGQWVKWDGGHWNWISNSFSGKYTVVDSLSAVKTVTNMENYENKLIQLTESGFPGLSGTFAIVVDGKKRIIDDKSRGWKAMATLEVRKNRTGLTKAAWDAIPTGEVF